MMPYRVGGRGPEVFRPRGERFDVDAQIIELSAMAPRRRRKLSFVQRLKALFRRG